MAAELNQKVLMNMVIMIPFQSLSDTAKLMSWDQVLLKEKSQGTAVTLFKLLNCKTHGPLYLQSEQQTTLHKLWKVKEHCCMLIMITIPPCEEELILDSTLHRALNLYTWLVLNN